MKFRGDFLLDFSKSIELC